MDQRTRARVAASQRERYAHLRALKRGHARMLELLAISEGFVREAAERGDSLARYVVEQLDAASDELALAGIAATSDVLTSNGSEPTIRREQGAGVPAVERSGAT